MFALMTAHYAGVGRIAFEADLAEKRWVILIHGPGSGRLCGFSTQTILTTEVGGRPGHGLLLDRDLVPCVVVSLGQHDRHLGVQLPQHACGRAALLRGHAALHRLNIVEVQMGDQVIIRLAAWRPCDAVDLEASQARHLPGQWDVLAEVDPLERFGIAGLFVERHQLNHRRRLLLLHSPRIAGAASPAATTPV